MILPSPKTSRPATNKAYQPRILVQPRNFRRKLKIWTKFIARTAENQAIWKKSEDLKAYNSGAIDPTMAGFLVTVIHCTQPHLIGTKQDYQHDDHQCYHGLLCFPISLQPPKPISKPYTNL